MITQQEIRIRCVAYLKTTSDMYRIRQIETGAVYDEAIDVIPCQYTYEETDEPLPEQPIEEQPEPTE